MTVFRRPWRIPRQQLEAALRFEFELKFDGQSLDRSKAAISAFERFLQHSPRIRLLAAPQCAPNTMVLTKRSKVKQGLGVI